MLRNHEKDAVFSLLVRQVEAQELRKSAEAVMVKAKEDIANANLIIKNIAVGLSVYGFDMSVSKPWDIVRDAIGSDMYVKAIRVAEGREKLEDDSLETEVPKDEPPQDDPDETDGNDEETQIDEPAAPKIREIIIETLAAAGHNGMKVAQIKEHIIDQGIEMHEKTTGMTLYRLSKEGLARRDGRTWFYVAPKSRGDETNSAEESATNVPSADVFN